MDTNTDIIIREVERSPLVDEAISGLLGELKGNSAHVYEAEIEAFLVWSRGQRTSPAVVLSRYLKHLREDRKQAASTVNKKRIILRRFFEWALRVRLIDSSIFADVQSVKGIKSHGNKAGNWITVDQLQCLINAPDTTTEIGRRDRALLAMLIGCALRRSEATSLTWGQLLRHGEAWVFQNVERKHSRMQEYIAVPGWVKEVLDAYGRQGDEEPILTSYDRHGNRRGSITAPSAYRIVKQYTEQCGFGEVAPHDLRRSWARAANSGGLALTQIQAQLGHESVQTTQKYVNEIMRLEAVAGAVELEV